MSREVNAAEDLSSSASLCVRIVALARSSLAVGPQSIVELPATPFCPPLPPSTLPSSGLLPELLQNSIVFSGQLQASSWCADTPLVSVHLRSSFPAHQRCPISPPSPAPSSSSLCYSVLIIIMPFVSFAFIFSLTYQFFHEIAFLPCSFAYLLSSPAIV